MEQETEQTSEQRCRVTLVGPITPERSRSPVRLWTGSPWRRLVVEMEVGGPNCPDWDHANVCLVAIQDLIKMNDGFMTDELVEAISTHLKVVEQETFRGPYVPE